MGKRTVQDAIVDDIQKRRFPTKYYVYVIHVTWSDGSVNIIYRRYSRFFDFQMKLLSLFPDESGARNPTQRMIPFLPGKKLFGRSQTREVASKRLVQLNEYCSLLVRLPSKVSECDEVIQFFTPTSEDINPTTESNVLKKGGKEIDVISDPIQPDPYIVIADYKKQQKNEIDLHAGEHVDVFEKNDNGWWFISASDNQGWAPATFLSRADGMEDEEAIAGVEERYITNNSYTAKQEDEVSFETGVIVTVKQKSLDGWWMVSYQDKVGWVPAAFLQVYTGPVDVVASAPVQRVGNVMSVSDIIGRRQGGDAAKNSPQLARRDDLQGHGTEAKPTPPRRSTVRRTVRKGATRKPKARAQAASVEYYTVCDFSDDAGDSISFKSGQKVQVVQETDSGWWLVRIGDQEGWAPSSYIEAKKDAAEEVRPRRSSADALDEETGESTTRPQRPPPPSGRQVGGAAFRPVPIPSGASDKSNGSAFTPVTPTASNGRRPLPVAPAARPVPEPVNVGGGSRLSYLQNAQANLKPTKNATGQATPPPVNRGIKPNVTKSPAPKPRSDNRPTQVSELKKQLQSMNIERAPPAPKPTIPAASTSTYVTTGDYENADEDGLSFREGMTVELLERNESGWWLVRIGDQEGWAPSTYLEKC